jgi:hypothetical protein
MKKAYVLLLIIPMLFTPLLFASPSSNYQYVQYEINYSSMTQSTHHNSSTALHLYLTLNSTKISSNQYENMIKLIGNITMTSSSNHFRMKFVTSKFMNNNFTKKINFTYQFKSNFSIVSKFEKMNFTSILNFTKNIMYNITSNTLNMTYNFTYKPIGLTVIQFDGVKYVGKEFVYNLNATAKYNSSGIFNMGISYNYENQMKGDIKTFIQGLIYSVNMQGMSKITTSYNLGMFNANQTTLKTESLQIMLISTNIPLGDPMGPMSFIPVMFGSFGSFSILRYI